MAASVATTNLLRLSIDSVPRSSAATTGELHVGNSAHLRVGGTSQFSSTVSLNGNTVSTATTNLQSAKLLSKQTTASFTSLTLVDGEFAVGALSVTSCVLYFRSGVTIYRFIADAAAVI